MLWILIAEFPQGDKAGAAIAKSVCKTRRRGDFCGKIILWLFNYLAVKVACVFLRGDKNVLKTFVGKLSVIKENFSVAKNVSRGRAVFGVFKVRAVGLV